MPLANYMPSSYVVTQTTASTNVNTVVDAMQESLYQQAYVWNLWNGGTGTSVTCNSASTDVAWRIWTDAGTTGSSITLTDQLSTAANQVWGMDSWQDCKHTQVRWTPTVYKSVPERVKTPEEIAAEAAKLEIRRRQLLRNNAKQRRFKSAAAGRARQLLMSMLTAEQQNEMEDKNCFHLTVHDRDGSHRVYRIDYGYAGNVKLIGQNGRPTHSYCIHADSRLPKEDQMLAQKLLLEANEKDFLRIANMTRCAA